MALSSMTGFARSHGASGPYAFEWELKSVNAKGFDLRLRLPPGWDELEAFAKKRAGEVLSRGTVYANLNVKRANAVSTVRINEDVLASIVKVAGELAGKIDAVAPSIDGLLGDQGRDRGRRARKRRGRGQGGEGRRRRQLSTRRSPIWSRCAGARARRSGRSCSQRMDEIERLAKQGGSRARPQARGDQGAARRADRGLAGSLRPLRCRPAQPGSAPDRDQGRHPRGARPHRLPCRAGARDDRQGRPGRAPARFPGAGIQPRGQYLLLEVERSSN